MTALRSIARLAFALLCAVLTAQAGVSVDESAVFAFDTRDNLAGLAAESAVFAFDTRLPDGLSGAAVSSSFAFDTRGVTAPPLLVAGILRTASGLPVAGATVTLKRGGAIFWQGTSDASGAFTAPSLVGVNYTVTVTKPGYVTSITNLTGIAGGTQTVNLRLAAMPAPPTAVAVTRTPAATAVRAGPDTSDPAYPVLERYDGSQLVYVVNDPITGLDPNLYLNRPTVVIAHGWESAEDPNSYATALDWVKALAALIQNHHPGLPQTPNILVWDWRHKANTYLPQVDDAAEEGIELGKALHKTLGTTYNQHLHFVGHSLGTIVDRYACDYLHGSLSGYQSRDNPADPWPASLTAPHITMLDEAEVATILGQQVFTSAVNGWWAAQQATGNLLAGVATGVAAGAVTAKTDWKYPIPKDAVWVDNYISAFGFQRADAVNVCLPAEALASGNPISAHSYAHLWYRNSVNPPGAPPAIGYNLSRESTSAFPPSGSGQTIGNLWYENLATPNPLDLTLAPDPNALNCTLQIWSTFAIVGGARLADTIVTQPLDTVGRGVLTGYEAGIMWAGDVGGTAIVKTGQVVTETTEKVGLWWDAAMDKASNVFDSVNPETLLAGPLAASTFRLRLQKQTAPAPFGGQVAAASAQAPQAWVTVAVPANAGLMAFDFTVTGDPVNDRLACAVNEQNVFTLPAKFATEGEPMSTDLLDVSVYAGQTIELFFGLVGGTSANCEVAIDGIRFVTLPTPKVGVADAGANVAVKWPAAASGWVLEETASLTQGNWQPVPIGSGVSVDFGVATVERPKDGTQKFFRLRRRP